jgi:hypothetical protein
MDTSLIEIELIEDASMVAAYTAELRSKGEMLVCRRCNDATEVIAGVLVIDLTGERWALCGPCWRELPEAPHVI